MKQVNIFSNTLVGLLLSTYCLGAFYSTSFNIVEWSDGTRALSYIIAVVSLFAAGLVTFFHKEDSK